MSSVSSLEKESLIRQYNEMSNRIAVIERLLQGQPISTVRIADASITNAKIQGLAAEKILAGNLIVQVGVGKPRNGAIILDGVNVRETMIDANSDTRLLIGDDGT